MFSESKNTEILVLLLYKKGGIDYIITADGKQLSLEHQKVGFYTLSYLFMSKNILYFLPFSINQVT